MDLEFVTFKGSINGNTECHWKPLTNIKWLWTRKQPTLNAWMNIYTNNSSFEQKNSYHTTIIAHDRNINPNLFTAKYIQKPIILIHNRQHSIIHIFCLKWLLTVTEIVTLHALILSFTQNTLINLESSDLI